MGAWSPFAGAVTETLEIPESGGKTITIRRLGWKALEEASRLSSSTAVSTITAYGGVEVIKALESLGGEQAVRREAPISAPFDRAYLITRGVVTWPDGLTPTAEAIEDLDATFALWLADAIVRLSRPSTETDRKNG